MHANISLNLFEIWHFSFLRHLRLRNCTVRLKRDDTRAETRFRLSPKRTSPFKSVGESVQSTGSRVGHISVSSAGYNTFRGSVKSTGYPLHSPVSPSLHISCVTVCHQVSNALYHSRQFHIADGNNFSTISIKFDVLLVQNCNCMGHPVRRLLCHCVIVDC